MDEESQQDLNQVDYEGSFLQIENEGKQKYSCRICSKFLSSKQRIMTHLSRKHNFGQIKRVKKLYLDDPQIPIPKRTQMWQRSQKRFGETSSQTADVESASSATEADGSMATEIECSSIKPLSVHSNILRDSDLVTNSQDTSIDADIEMLSTNLQPLQEYILEQNSVSVSDSSTDVSDTDVSDESDQSGYDSYCCNSDFSLPTSSDSDSDSSNDNSDVTSDYEKLTVQQQSETELQHLAILSYVIRHNLTDAAGTDLMSLLKLFCSDEKLFVSYKKLLGTMSTARAICTHYCNMCYRTFPVDGSIYKCQTQNCTGLRYKGGESTQLSSSRKPSCSFTIGDIKQQLKYVIEKDAHWKELLETKKYVRETMQCFNFSDDFTIKDICDGRSYRELNKTGGFLSYEYAFSCILNTDGVPLFSSTKEKLWPIFLAINELPITRRFSRENLIIAGIWQGKSNPPFYQYFSALGQEMKKLYAEGFKCHGVTTKFGIFLGTLDLQAKGYVTNMTMHNGAFGCITCEEEGKSVKQGKGTARHYPYKSEDKPAYRNHETFIQSGLEGTSEKRIKGICGPSGLISMPFYDIVVGTVPDYMHGALLGVTKTLMKKHFSSVNSGKPYFVGKKINLISRRMMSIKPPDCIERIPRDLEKNYLHFKATELQSWLLYYCLPCLHGILPAEYLKHLACLSEGISILLGDSISHAELERAQKLLEHFYRLFANLYGSGSCGLNVHNIGEHLVFYVKQWGPLFCWSCFGFEDANANILSYAHGTADVTRQILCMKEMHMLIKSVQLVENTPCGLFFKKMNERFSKRWTNMVKLDECFIAGRDVAIVLTERTRQLFENTFKKLADIRKVLRIEHHGTKYYSAYYTKLKKKCSHIVLCKDGRIVEILWFIWDKSCGSVYLYGYIIEVTDSPFFFEWEGHHIMQVEKTFETVILPIKNLQEKLFFMDIEDKHFVSRIPNIYGHGVLK